MTTTLTPPATDRRPAVIDDLRSRAAGLGALGFAGVVIAQNLVRSGAPQPGADLAEVTGYYGDHRSVMVGLVLSFAVGLGALATFLGGTLRRLLDSPQRGWAILGWVGAGTVIALFAGVVAGEQALTVVAGSDVVSPGAVEALWALHNSIFTVNQMFIALALVGLSRAGVAAGITPGAFRRIAPVAAGLLVVGAATGPLTAAGDALPFFGLSVLGFVGWLAFLIATGLRLVRSES